MSQDAASVPLHGVIIRTDPRGYRTIDVEAIIHATRTRRVTICRPWNAWNEALFFDNTSSEATVTKFGAPARSSEKCATSWP